MLNLLRCYLLIFLLLVSANFSHAGYPPYVPKLQPYQITSPNGTYLFDVKPSNPDGTGPCMVALTIKDTKECVWKRKLPFTFWQACVADDGVVFGFGYNAGPLGNSIPEPGICSNFIVRIFDEKGDPFYEETTKRLNSSGGLTGSIPSHAAYQILLDSNNQRMILRMANGSFRSYSTGIGLESAVLPNLKDSEGRFSCIDAHVIPGTPLLLLQFGSATFKDEQYDLESLFCVMDRQGTLIWTFKSHWRQPHDFADEYYPQFKIVSVSPVTAQSDPNACCPPLNDPLAEAEKFIGPQAPWPVAEFDLGLGGSEERVTCRLSHIRVENEDFWSVTEMKRSKWTSPKETENHPPKKAQHLDGKKLGEFQLLGSDNKPLSKLAAVTMGPKEQIYALEAKSGFVHVFDRDGKLLHLCKPGKNDPFETESQPSLAVNDQGEVFVKRTTNLLGQNSDNHKPDPKAGFIVQFSPVGVLREKLISVKWMETRWAWHTQPKTKNLVFASDSIWGGSGLTRRDERGASNEAFISERADGLWLEYVSDFSFASDGSIAVRNSPQGNSFAGFGTDFPRLPSHLPEETITLYKPNGKPIRTIDFTDGTDFDRIAYDGSYIVATNSYARKDAFVYILKASGEAVGFFRIDDLSGKENVSVKPFIVEKGNAILVIDTESARVFRYAMPK